MDRETVITHLQIIHTWAEFARERDLQFFTAKHLDDIAKWADDALNLLKEQEPVEVITTYSVNGFKHWYCSNCPSELPIGANYCSNCGRRLKWHG